MAEFTRGTRVVRTWNGKLLAGTVDESGRETASGGYDTGKIKVLWDRLKGPTWNPRSSLAPETPEKESGFDLWLHADVWMLVDVGYATAAEVAVDIEKLSAKNPDTRFMVVPASRGVEDD